MIAVVVDEALRIAVEIAVPLQPGIEIVDIGFDTGRDAGIDDLEARPVEVDAGALRCCPDQVFAAEKDCGAELLVGIGHRRAHAPALPPPRQRRSASDGGAPARRGWRASRRSDRAGPKARGDSRPCR